MFKLSISAALCTILTAAGFAFPPLFKSHAAVKTPPPASEIAHTTPASEEPDPAVELMRKQGERERAARERATQGMAYRSRSQFADDVQPELHMPDVIEGEPDDFIKIKAETNCEEIVFYPVTKGLKVFPREFLNPEVAKAATIVIAKLEGDYTMIAVGALNSKVAGPVEFIVRVGHAPQPPPGPGPGPIPPGPNPPVVKVQNLMIITLDDAVKRNPGIAAVLTDPYWQQIATKGHQRRQYNTTNAEAVSTYAEQLKANGGLPVVIVLDAATMKWLNRSPEELKLPANAASLKTLLARYTDNLP